MQEDMALVWGDCDVLLMDGGGMTGGVPIPRSQPPPQVIDPMTHPSGGMLGRTIHTSNPGTSGSAGVPGSPFLQNNMSPSHQVYQQSLSPGIMTQGQNTSGFQTNNDGMNFADSYNTGLSPMPANSPSPHMWQTQSMDLDNDVFNVKLEPLEMLNNDANLLQFNNVSDQFDLLNDGPDEMMCEDKYLNDFISGSSMNGPTCLDPQHSSPAAMAAVRPNEVLGLGQHSSGHSAGSGNSVSSLSRLVIHSDSQPTLNFLGGEHPNMLQANHNLQQIQQSQSFTDSSFLSTQMNSGASAALLTGGTVKVEQTPIENSDSCLASSFPPPNSGWKDQLINNPSFAPTVKQMGNVNVTNPTMIMNKNSPLPGPSPRDQYVQDALQEILSQCNKPQTNQAMSCDEQHMQVRHQQMQSTSLPQNYLMQSQQRMQMHKLQLQQNQIVKNEDQMQEPVQVFDQHTLHMQRQFQQPKSLSPTQQLVIQQKQQIPLKNSSQQQIPMHKDLYGSSFPLTPNNTPIQSGLNIPSTLKEMLQSNSGQIGSPISPQSAASPVSCSSPLPVNSPGNASSPLASAVSPSTPHSGLDEHLSYTPLGQSVPSGSNVLSSQFSPSMQQQSARMCLQNSPQFNNPQLSSSAPAPNMIEQMWVRREPRKHLLSTGSLAEEQFGGSASSLSLLSPANDESCLDSDEESEVNYESDSDNESMTHDGGGAGPSSSGGGSRQKERHFWQYNVQAKGPKGQRVSLEPRNTDPHQLVTVADPVFSEAVCSIQGIKHSGKARRGDGNDLNPNPEKLVSIGKQLGSLNQMIMDMTPVAEQPFQNRPKSRKEKNKLASRACRLKKKAQHEANKIKLYGLGEEHKFLLDQVAQCRAILNRKLVVATEGLMEGDPETLQHKLTEMLFTVAAKKPFQIAGQTTDFVNNVIDNCRRGRSSGGLDDITKSLDGLRTSAHEDGSGKYEAVTDYMAEFN